MTVAEWWCGCATFRAGRNEIVLKETTPSADHASVSRVSEFSGTSGMTRLVGVQAYEAGSAPALQPKGFRIKVVDRLTVLPDAIGTVFPRTAVQAGVGQVMWSAVAYVSWRGSRQVVPNLHRKPSS